MDILTFVERLYHVRVIAKVSHDAQLYLRIVGREELASIIGDESLSNLFSILVSDRNILQVRVT